MEHMEHMERMGRMGRLSSERKQTMKVGVYLCLSSDLPWA